MQQDTATIIKDAAYKGVYMGVLLITIFVCMMVSSAVTVASVVGLLLMAAVPYVTFLFMRRFQRQAGERQQLSALWMYGIMLFVFGGVIGAVAVYVCLQYIAPNYIHDQVLLSLEVYRSNPGLVDAEVVDTLQKMCDENMLPSAIQCAISGLWFAAFAGSILSLIEACIVRAVYRQPNNN